MYWFAPCEGDDRVTLEEYRLIGKLIGLAIYNSVILDLHFPLALYKILLGHYVGLADLASLDPALHTGLVTLLSYEGPVEEVYQRHFTYEYDLFGTLRTFDLVPNGSTIPLSTENRDEYVSLLADCILRRLVDLPLRAFCEGFHAVVQDSAIQIFRPEEVEILVCGSVCLHFDELEKVTLYDGGFTKDSLTIRHFWDIVHEFSNEQKKRLLFFTTGSDRVPIGGLAKMNFVISRNGPDSDRLPTAHTCFNVLLLCEYRSKEKLRERLLTAIQNAEGFGLI